MQLSGNAKERLMTIAAHHYVKTENKGVLAKRVPGERWVMKVVLKAPIWTSITQITASLYNPL